MTLTYTGYKGTNSIELLDKKVYIMSTKDNTSEVYHWALVQSNGQALFVQLVYFLNLGSGFIFLTKKWYCLLVKNNERVSEKKL